MGGQVVRGKAGQRQEYRPIQSLLSVDARPTSVGCALAEAGFRTTYVADLDAILGGSPAWSIYETLMRSGLELWVDAGLSTAAQAREMANFEVDARPLSAIVAGLESLRSPEELAAMRRTLGAERLIFSLDMKNGAPLGGPEWGDLAARQIAILALRMGVRRMLVLDLASVGMGRGTGTEPLCRELRSLDRGLEIITGGGVRSLADLRSLKAAGCDAALVASALHDEKFNAADCVSLRDSRPSGRRPTVR